MRLRVEDTRKAGYCMSGQREFCRLHGIDFRAYVRDGIEVSRLSEIEDHNLTRALAFAAEREAREKPNGQERT